MGYLVGKFWKFFWGDAWFEKRQRCNKIACRATLGLFAPPWGLWGAKTDNILTIKKLHLPSSDLPSSCPCGPPFTVQHAMDCKRGGFVSIRLNQIRDLLFISALRMSMPNSMQKPLDWSDSQESRAREKNAPIMIALFKWKMERLPLWYLAPTELWATGYECEKLHKELAFKTFN